MNKVIVLLIFFMLGTCLSSSICYLTFGLILLFYIIKLFTSTSTGIHLKYKEDFVALSFLLVWAYGILLGFLLGNKTDYVISNFAGFTCYSIYFVLLRFNIQKKSIVKVLLIAGISVSIISSIKFLSSTLGFFNPMPSFFCDGDIIFNSYGDLRYYHPSISSVYTIFGGALCMIIYNPRGVNLIHLQNKLVPILLLLMSLFVVFIVINSKGFTLALIFIFVCLIIVPNVKNILNIKTNLVISLIIIAAFIFFFLYFDLLSFIQKIFDADDSSNAERYYQLKFIMDDFSFFGRGLGAVVPGVTRSIEEPYGYELTYLNIIHKFGFFSLFIFFNWFYMIKYVILNLYNRRNLLVSSILISSFAYFVPGMGNPILLAPGLVVLNSLTLYYIRLDRK